MAIPFQNTYIHLPADFHKLAAPIPVKQPGLIAVNDDLARELGIDPAFLRSEEGLAILSGNTIPEGSESLAMAYSGHQFGGFSPQLGDGRAILLGEVAGMDLQLKGAGRTPFSRRGDGRSALGPVLREYLVSEAMAALGVPTTRALAALTTGDHVMREEPEPGGIFTRIASSHLRIGTAQFFAARGDQDNLRALVDYTIKRHYPTASDALDLLRAIIEKQAHLIAQWMGFGFIHGVMNTDNMTLSGETIDYGPCAFMDRYHPARKFSYIDQQGRYAYQNQPPIAQWNLTRLAEALLPLISEDQEKAVEMAQEELKKFPAIYEAARLKIFSNKLGLADNDDWEIVQDLLDLMSGQEADFTLVFRHLGGDQDQLLSQFRDRASIKEWLRRWQKKGGIDLALMKKTNPIFIPRNHRVEEVIQAGVKGDFAPFHRLHKILKTPYEEQPEEADFEQSPERDQIVCATFCGT